ncbi:MAG: hypothetical protein JXR95_01100 [Deltaproteobacteria bacterium]|nr:hypothetical protein [Deltaproteobacteria bacterium]
MISRNIPIIETAVFKYFFRPWMNYKKGNITLTGFEKIPEGNSVVFLFEKYNRIEFMHFLHAMYKNDKLRYTIPAVPSSEDNTISSFPLRCCPDLTVPSLGKFISEYFESIVARPPTQSELNDLRRFLEGRRTDGRNQSMVKGLKASYEANFLKEMDSFCGLMKKCAIDKNYNLVLPLSDDRYFSADNQEKAIILKTLSQVNISVMGVSVETTGKLPEGYTMTFRIHDSVCELSQFDIAILDSSQDRIDTVYSRIFPEVSTK